MTLFGNLMPLLILDLWKKVVTFTYFPIKIEQYFTLVLQVISETEFFNIYMKMDRNLRQSTTQKICYTFISIPSIEEAIHNEKLLKKWNRSWKLKLIQKKNPEFKNLAIDWFDEDYV